MEEYISIEEILKLDDNELLLVSRILILSEIAINQNLGRFEGIKAQILSKAKNNIFEVDQNSEIPCFGVIMNVGEIKQTFDLKKLNGNYFKQANQKVLKKMKHKDI